MKKRFFPKIKFVDSVPYAIACDTHLKKGEKLNGTYTRNTKQIYVVRRKGSWKTLLHELTHWLIDLFFDWNSKLHDWLDK